MNVLAPDKRLKVFRLLLDGFSIRETCRRVGCHNNTVLRYMHLLKIRRTRGHRSPVAYLHRNQCKSWWQQHETPPQKHDEAALLELQWLALAGKGKIPRRASSRPDPDALGYQQGRAYLAQCRRILRERTKRHTA